MTTKTIILAVALIIFTGTAFAAEPFATLDGVPAQSLDRQEMAEVVGTLFVTRVTCLTCGSSTGTTTLGTTTTSRGLSIETNVGALTPHPRFPGTPNPSGKLVGWSGGL